MGLSFPWPLLLYHVMLAPEARFPDPGGRGLGLECTHSLPGDNL